MTYKLIFKNWWGEDGKEWFVNFFNYCFSLYNLNTNVTINLYTLFGNFNNITEKLDNSNIKIFIYGENTRLNYYSNYKEQNVYQFFDIIAGFFQDTDKSTRFPLWAWYIPFWKNGLFTPINNNRENAAILVAHNKANRVEICKQIEDTGTKVYSTLQGCGQTIKIGNSIPDKIKSISNYKYNICPENSDAEGYTTEKLMQSLYAGCIPIYYPCRPIEKDIINNNNIIFVDENLSKNLKSNKNLENIWMPDAQYHVMMIYYNLWKKIYNICKTRNIILSRKESIEIVIYEINSLNKSEIESILKNHYKIYNTLFTPKPVFKLNENIVEMEDIY
jgi:hypothetical protein